jgi:hypothetical protein
MDKPIENTEKSFCAFAGFRLLARGDLRAMLLQTKTYLDAGGGEQVLIFENDTGKQIDFDFRGTPQEVVSRAMAPEPRRGPGRPRMGVESGEVTLLPAQWEWLERQPRKASGTLRWLIEAARRNETAAERSRQLLEAAGRFLWSLAGNLEGFEEASRALYARNWPKLEELTAAWPPDLRGQLAWMVRRVREAEGQRSGPVQGPPGR